MKGAGLTQSARFFCLILALSVHAAAAAAFMLAPATKPPETSEGVEIEMLAEITSEDAPEIEPAVAAQSMVAEAAMEAQPGEVQSVMGQQEDSLAPVNTEQAEVTPDQVKEVEKTEKVLESQDTPEVKPTEEPVTMAAVEPTEVTAVETPVELETPVVEAPEAPALAKKPKPAPAAKKEKKVKTQQRRAQIMGSTLTKEATRKGASQAQRSGGAQSNAAYKSIVFGRIVARRPAMMAKVRQNRTLVVTISFTIGAGGSVRSASVSKSSGDAGLDSDIRAIVASINFPPPPPGAKASWAVPIKLSSR
jgi:protein TonB